MIPAAPWRSIASAWTASGCDDTSTSLPRTSLPRSQPPSCRHRHPRAPPSRRHCRCPRPGTAVSIPSRRSGWHEPSPLRFSAVPTTRPTSHPRQAATSACRTSSYRLPGTAGSRHRRVHSCAAVPRRARRQCGSPGRHASGATARWSRDCAWHFRPKARARARRRRPRRAGGEVRRHLPRMLCTRSQAGFVARRAPTHWMSPDYRASDGHAVSAEILAAERNAVTLAAHFRERAGA